MQIVQEKEKENQTILHITKQNKNNHEWKRNKYNHDKVHRRKKMKENKNAATTRGHPCNTKVSTRVTQLKPQTPRSRKEQQLLKKIRTRRATRDTKRKKQRHETDKPVCKLDKVDEIDKLVSRIEEEGTKRGTHVARKNKKTNP